MWIERSFDFYYPKTTVIIGKQRANMAPEKPRAGGQTCPYAN